MLPKPEKTKKNLQNPEQLSLVDPPKKEVNLKGKRIFVASTLIASVLLCLSFSIYHQVKSKNFKIALPKFNSRPTSISVNKVDNEIASALSGEKNVWFVFAKDLSTGKELNWSGNQSNFNVDISSVLSQVSSLKSSNSNSGLLSSVLPGGVAYSDSRQNQNADLLYSAILTVPQKDILIFLKITNGSNLDQNQINQKIAEVSEKIYWSLIN